MTDQHSVVFSDPESILKKKLGDDMSVVDYESEPFTKAGDNYGSTMLRVTISVTGKNAKNVEKLDLIAKLLPSSDLLREIFESDYTFKKEIFFYEQLLPTYQDIYKKEFKIAPQYYGSRMSLEPDTDKMSDDAVLLLENLKVTNYYMQDRRKGLDLNHLNILIPAIAKFHAIGLSLKNKKPSFLPVLEKYIRPLKHLSAQERLFEKSLNAIKKHPEVNRYYDRVKALYDDTKDASKTLPLEDPWASVVHLDLWNNNIMFHRDENGKIDGVKIVDFQTYSVFSPLADLIFLLCSSMQHPMEHFDSMIELYRSSASKTLKELNFDVPLFEKQQFEERLKIDAIGEIVHIVLMANIVELREGENFEKDPANAFTIGRWQHVFEIYERKKWF